MCGSLKDCNPVAPKLRANDLSLPGDNSDNARGNIPDRNVDSCFDVRCRTRP